LRFLPSLAGDRRLPRPSSISDLREINGADPPLT
jgi:hypothetical protein